MWAGGGGGAGLAYRRLERLLESVFRIAGYHCFRVARIRAVAEVDFVAQLYAAVAQGHARSSNRALVGPVSLGQVANSS